MDRRPAMPRNSGFSLVELLLALTLMSMLLALAYGGLRASTQATEKGQKILDDSNRIRMAHQFVRRQMTQLLPLAFEEDLEQNRRSVFRGEPQRIRYVAQMPGYLGFGGPQVQEMELVQGEDGLELVLSHALLQGFDEPYLYLREPILLLDKIESARFSFLGLDEFGEAMSWATNWAEEENLPAAVSLEVEFIDGVFIDWPVLTTSVRIDRGAVASLDGSINRADYSSAIRDLMNKRKGSKQ